jgi:hypothetical protein
MRNVPPRELEDIIVFDRFRIFYVQSVVYGIKPVDDFIAFKSVEGVMPLRLGHLKRSNKNNLKISLFKCTEAQKSQAAGSKLRMDVLYLLGSLVLDEAEEEIR